jgi:hypothetical protein
MYENNDTPRCQCDPKCMNKPLSGKQPFCEKHAHGKCRRIAPLSGYEPNYDPQKYNATRRTRESHNCFAYAFDHYDIPPENECNEKSCPVPFHQPGRKSGFPKWKHVQGKRCPDLLARLKADVPGVKLAKFSQMCPKGTSKIAFVTDPKEDYHFYRQDSNGLWSHKPGATNVINTDAHGKIIYDPELASRNYSNKGNKINYKHFCSYMCVPRRKHTFKRGGKQQTRRKKTKQRHITLRQKRH